MGLVNAWPGTFLTGQTNPLFWTSKKNSNTLRWSNLKRYVSNLGYALCDLRDVTKICNTAKKAVDFFGGRIDVLINNGGIACPQWKGGKTMADPRNT